MRIEKSFDIPIYNADRRGTALPFGTSFLRTFGGHGASRTQKQKRQKICNRYFFHGLSPYDFRFINGNLIAPSAIIARQYNRQQLLFLRGFYDFFIDIFLCTTRKVRRQTFIKRCRINILRACAARPVGRAAQTHYSASGFIEVIYARRRLPTFSIG